MKSKRLGVFLIVICISFLTILSIATRGAAAEWKLMEGDEIRYRIETLRQNGTTHADEIENDYIFLYDVNEGDVFTVRVEDIYSGTEECEWDYSIWLGGREVSGSSHSTNRPCSEWGGLEMIFPVENRDYYDSVVASINGYPDNRTANLNDTILEIEEETQSYNETVQWNIAKGYHTYYYREEGEDIFAYEELELEQNKANSNSGAGLIPAIVALLIVAFGLGVVISMVIPRRKSTQ